MEGTFFVVSEMQTKEAWSMLQPWVKMSPGLSAESWSCQNP